MSKATGKAALAVGAHPDDVEFMMAGTLILLRDMGYEPHVFTIANGSCGTTEYTEEEIIRIRGQEAKNAAEMIGATYHPGIVNDIEIFYDDNTLRRVCAIIREIDPEIVLLPSTTDYMEDHQNAGRLVVTACFCKCMPNYKTIPERDAVAGDIFLYHAAPHGFTDGMRRLVMPGEFVIIDDVIDLKEKMLARHKSQKEWLDKSQGMDSYLHTMRHLSEFAAKLSRREGIKYAEGFRRHSHTGFSAKNEDKLKHVLGDRVIINEEYEKELRGGFDELFAASE